MAKSKVKKSRNKLEREGVRNPELNRGIFAMADMRTRTTKTKKDKMNQIKYKNRLFDHSGDGSNSPFFIVYQEMIKC
ncbi:hypothetical protein [Heyndrickxia acidicola]|uniref:Uncharacterized protein n=1 Tax=Heyndrickxia acidicola TaxID=209389 RepID=A0ABU6MAG1_9BACI|nr:hypothetical protein [Heyndrickxia acidicola]MED1201655.1 hypothetical protein [Heyndrickxia acidicola]